MNELEKAAAKVRELEARRADLQAALTALTTERQAAITKAGQAMADGGKGSAAVSSLEVIGAKLAATTAGLEALEGAEDTARQEYRAAQAAAAQERAEVVRKELDALIARIGGALARVRDDVRQYQVLALEADALAARFRATVGAVARLDIRGIEAVQRSYDQATAPDMATGRAQEREAQDTALTGEALARVAALGPALPAEPDKRSWTIADYSGPKNSAGRPILAQGQSAEDMERKLAQDRRAWEIAHGVPVTPSRLLDSPQAQKAAAKAEKQRGGQDADNMVRSWLAAFGGKA